MIQKLFIYIIICILSVSLVLASAGGGGSSSSSSSATSGGSSSASSSSSSNDGPYFYGLECFDTGQLTFKQKPAIQSVIAEKEDGTTLTIAGKWEGSIFTSEEAEINQAGTYTIRDAKNGNRSVECPGLKFSCRAVELEIQEYSCEDGKIKADFTLNGEGTSIEELLFQFKKGNSLSFLEYQIDKTTSPELKGIQIQVIGNNEYTLEVDDVSSISELKITYPECIGKHYVSSKADCVKKESGIVWKKMPSTILEKETIDEHEREPANIFFTKIISFLKRLFLE